MVSDFQDIRTDKTLAFFGRVGPRNAIACIFYCNMQNLKSWQTLLIKKNTGFDLYWFAVALNRAAQYPDEIERCLVKMLEDFNPLALKRSFRSPAMKILAENTGKG